MTSQALYRKWRSQTFDELVGQEHVVQTLRNAIAADRVGHAYLFTGPRGIGKTTVARLLAKAVNCEASVELRPCDQCDPCRAIAGGRAVDVIEMDAASHTGVDDAREIIERVQFRPTSFRVKVYVIDEAHMLSTAAFNALLKTLEEPPAHVLFILATTEFHKVPATIVSRCQRFVFTRHSVSQIAQHLQHVAEAEQVELQEGVPEVIARSATGAMRDALSVLDQLMAGSDGVVTLAQAHALLGAAESGDVMALIRSLANEDLGGALRLIHQLADSGVDLRQFARDLVERLRGLMLLAATNDQSMLDLPVEIVQEMQAITSRVAVSQLVSWLKLLSNLDYQLKNSAYGQLPIELAVVELLAVRTAPEETAPAPARPARMTRSTTTQRPAPVAAATASRPAAPPESTKVEPERIQAATEPVGGEGAVDTSPEESTPRVIKVVDDAAFPLEEIEELWPQFVEDVRSEDRLVFAQMEGVTPINVEEQTVVLLARKGKWQKSMLERERTLRLLERMLGKALRGTARIRVTTDEEEEMPDVRKQIQHARNDPLVRKAINIFEADVIGLDTL